MENSILEKLKDKQAVIDISFYINHRELSNFYTTHKIVDEAIKMGLLDFEYKAKTLRVSKKLLDRVVEMAREVGIFDYLSREDLELCSIALQLNKPIVLTNDKYIQNLCFFLNIDFYGDNVIRYAKIFRYRCSNYGSSGKSVICENCGSLRKRYVIKAIKVRKQ